MNIFRRLFRIWRKKRFIYEPLIEVRIHEEALRNNFNFFAKQNPSLEIAPVLKSNAYGHGLVQVAQSLSKEKIPFFCVDSFFEALILRNEGITKPILILGYTPLKNILENNLKNIYFSILSFDELKNLNNHLSKPAHFHLKIDTGMHRHGLDCDYLGEAIALIKQNKNLIVDGVYSHLADADTAYSDHLENQVVTWNKFAKNISEELPGVKHWHCAATFGALHSPRIFATTMRLGIGLYGFGPEENNGLEPVLEMRARISSIRSIAKGESVGYNAAFKATKPMRLATVPVGYTEGLDRRLSNSGSVIIRNQVCPIVGRVSMNISSVDVSNLDDLTLEDEVIVISNRSIDPNSIISIAKLCNTIPYEVLVHIPSHLRREVV